MKPPHPFETLPHVPAGMELHDFGVQQVSFVGLQTSLPVQPQARTPPQPLERLPQVPAGNWPQLAGVQQVLLCGLQAWPLVHEPPVMVPPQPSGTSPQAP